VGRYRAETYFRVREDWRSWSINSPTKALIFARDMEGNALITRVVKVIMQSPGHNANRVWNLIYPAENTVFDQINGSLTGVLFRNTSVPKNATTLTMSRAETKGSDRKP